MKLDIRNTSNKVTGSIEMPKAFNEPVREDLIKRSVLALQSARRQAYGANPEAGKRSSAYVSKRRHKFRSTYGIGQSRTPRKVMSVRGSRFNWVGAFAPQTVGGRRAHPAKALKNWLQKINRKENRKAINSAMAASLSISYIEERGQLAPKEFPFIIDNDFEQLNKTADVIKALTALGFADELDRANVTKVRAGKGKMRGRKTKTKTSLLLVSSKNCGLNTAAQNIAGVDCVTVSELNAEDLAPGTVPGRLTLYTKAAVEVLSNKKGALQKVSKEHVKSKTQNTKHDVQKADSEVTAQ